MPGAGKDRNDPHDQGLVAKELHEAEADLAAAERSLLNHEE